MNSDDEELSEILKTEILSSRLLTVVLKVEKKENTRPNDDRNDVNDYQSFSPADIDAIIGRIYVTRGIKRSYEEDSIPIEPNRNKYREKKKPYSLPEIERLRKKPNSKFPIF